MAPTGEKYLEFEGFEVHFYESEYFVAEDGETMPGDQSDVFASKQSVTITKKRKNKRGIYRMKMMLQDQEFY